MCWRHFHPLLQAWVTVQVSMPAGDSDHLQASSAFARSRTSAVAAAVQVVAETLWVWLWGGLAIGCCRNCETIPASGCSVIAQCGLITYMMMLTKDIMLPYHVPIHDYQRPDSQHRDMCKWWWASACILWCVVVDRWTRSVHKTKFETGISD